jgi:hypothetical protein
MQRSRKAYLSIGCVVHPNYTARRACARDVFLDGD